MKIRITMWIQYIKKQEYQMKEKCVKINCSSQCRKLLPEEAWLDGKSDPLKMVQTTEFLP